MLKKGVPEPDAWVWRHLDRENPDGSRTVLELVQGKDLRPGDRWRFYTGQTTPKALRGYPRGGGGDSSAS